MALCDSCERFDLQSFSNGFPIRSRPIRAIVQAANTGCNFCHLLVDILKDSRFSEHGAPYRIGRERHKLVNLAHMITGFKQRMVYGDLQLHVWVSQREQFSNDPERPLQITHLNAKMGRNIRIVDLNFSDQMSFHTAADPGSPAHDSGDIVGEILSREQPWSNYLIEDIKAWHKVCCETHVICRKTMSRNRSLNPDDAPLPTRCLEIIPQDDTVADKSSLSFVLRECKGQRGKYMTLSHRWTKDAYIARTTKSNVGCREGVCLHKSPCSSWLDNPITELFKEACWFTIRLGIRYIWIDSVCIVQDDAHDWKIESTKMAEYYQFSWLTLVAAYTSATGTWKGDFEPRGISTIAKLPYRDRSGQQKGHFYLQHIEKRSVAEKAAANSQLLKRGWVFQEYLLSPRVLVFLKNRPGPFMACHTGGSRIAMFSLFYNRDMASISGIFLFWSSIIENYCGLEFSKIESDRLIALSGIAAECGEALQKHPRSSSLITCYVSGLWIYDDASFLWAHDTSQMAERIPGFPTWSWASLKVLQDSEQNDTCSQGLSVKYLSYSRKPSPEVLSCVAKVEILHVDTPTWQPNFTEAYENLPANMYGNDGRFGVLCLRGRLFTVSIDVEFDDDEAEAIKPITDCQKPKNWKRHWRRVATNSSPDIVAGWASIEHPDYQTDTACRSASDIHAFFVLKSFSSEASLGLGNFRKRHPIYHVLYIRQVERPNYSPCYERVGMGRLFETSITPLFNAAPEQSIWLV